MNTNVLELTIEKPSFGPASIAHTSQGKLVFVHGALPGQKVRVHLVKDTQSYLVANTQEILEQSPSYTAPPCPYTAICGGCPWAGLDHQKQLEYKRALVIEQLVRTAKFENTKAEQLVSTTQAPHAPWGYRNKLELSYFEGKKPFWGLHAREYGVTGAIDATTPTSPGVVLKSCALLHPEVQHLPKALNGALSYLGNSTPVTINRVGIRHSNRTHELELSLWTPTGGFPRAQATTILSAAAHPTSVVRVMTKGPLKARKVSKVEALTKRGFWTEQVGKTKMSFSAPSFFQVSTSGAERLVELALNLTQPTKKDIAMDLYCGAGTFTLPLAREAAQVFAVESSASAVRDLTRNIQNAHLSNIIFEGGDAGREFPQANANIIIVDPPRAGLHPQVIELLSQQTARSIVYISCDMATLARDLNRFAQKGVYVPQKIVPVDMFSQSYHTECVCQLVRKTS